MGKKGRSKVHPNHKRRFRVKNWPAYDRALRGRGDITVWLTPAAIAAWTPLPTGSRGGQSRYSDVVIEAALTLRLVFQLPWRQTEGLLASIITIMGLTLDVPDHTTLSRRTAGLDVRLKHRDPSRPLDLVIDATGVGVFGEGEWAAAKWGGRGKRGWKKLHLAVDQEGVIVAVELTDKNVADATALPHLLEQIDATIDGVTADGAYDRYAVYQAIHDRGARSVIPPARTAKISGDPVLADRDGHLEHIERAGRRRWRIEVGQHQQARAECAIGRYKSTFGGRMRARNPGAQRAEALTACNILNRMTVLGGPVSERLDA